MTLDIGAASVTRAATEQGFYVGMLLTITGGSGSGQSRPIAAYSALGAVTVSLAFAAATDTTSTYSITLPSSSSSGGRRGRCRTSNQIAAVSSGDCRGRALSVVGRDKSCSSQFPYLKYPSQCPDDAEYTTVLKEAYTEPTFGPERSGLQRLLWRQDGIFASLAGKNSRPVEGATRVLHPNPHRTDSSSPTPAQATFVQTIEVEDAVALCGINIEGNLGASSAVTRLAASLSAGLLAGVVTTSGADPFDTNAFFGGRTSNSPSGWVYDSATPANGALGGSSAPASSFGFGYVIADKEILKVSAVSSNALTVIQRGAFGTAVAEHASATPLYGVTVCRGATLTFQPADGQMQQQQQRIPVTVPNSLPRAHVGTMTAHLTLAATGLGGTGTSTVPDFYAGLSLVITSGLGVGTLATIQTYTPSTRLVTATNTTSGLPLSGASTDSTSVYCISSAFGGCAMAAQTTSESVVALGAGASSVDGFYTGYNILAGSNTVRTIISYSGVTKIATVAAVCNSTTITTNATTNATTITTTVVVCSNATLSAEWTTAIAKYDRYSIFTLYTGTAGTATATSIVLSPGARELDNFYKGQSTTITSGPGVGQKRLIVAYAGSTRVATLATPWSVNPVAGESTYAIQNGGGGQGDEATLFTTVAYANAECQGYAQTLAGTAAAGGASNITLSGPSAEAGAADLYTGMTIMITAGAGSGDVRTIVAYSAARVATVNSPWSTAANATSVYTVGRIKPQGGGCTLRISSRSSSNGLSEEIVNRVNSGDGVRRIAAGRAQATTTLAPGGVTLGVSSAAALFGATFAFDSSASRYVACGADANLVVTGASLAANELAIAVSSANAALVAATCVPGTIVVVGENLPTTVFAGSSVQAAYQGPGFFNYLTTFDAAGTLDNSDSDVAEFSPHRFLRIDREIMRIVSVADANPGTVGSAREANGFERLTVARGQMGTQVEAHARGSTITLLPRRTESTVALTKLSQTVYVPSAMDLLANNLARLSLTTDAAATLVVAGRQVSSYIRIDDEIMRVTATNTKDSAAGSVVGDVASLTVLRGQAGTLAASHAAGSAVHVLGCMDGDETGSNCGGSCKPCSADGMMVVVDNTDSHSRRSGGPAQQDSLICLTPASASGSGGGGGDDLAVTVEVQQQQPGGGVSPSSPAAGGGGAVSCISEQNR